MSETLRILLLEDVPSDAELVEIELRQAGLRFTTLRVETELEFRRALADFQPDLILADYSLPSFNALEALRIANQQSPGVPFLLVTGSQPEEIAARVMKEGAHDYLLKSSLTRLPTAVRNALERKVAHQAKLQAEKELRQSEEKYRSVFNNFIDLYYQTDMQGLITILSPSCFILSGWKPEELIGHQVLEFYPDPEQRKAFLEKLHREGAVSDYEITLLHRDGRCLSVSVSCHLIRDEQGNPKYVEGTIRDITERKLAEEALRNREGLLQRIFDILPVGLWFADKDGTLLRGNPAGVKIWGAEPKVSLSEYGVFKALRLPSGEEVAPDDWALAHTIRDRVTIVDELLEIDAFDGKKKTILNFTAPVLDAQGDVQGAIVVNQDITERKRVEEALRESEALLQGVNEMAKVGGWQLDVETKQVLWTSETYRIHEIPEGERIDLPEALLFFDLPQRSTLETALQRCMETGEGFDLELPFTSAKGRHLWTRALGRAVKANNKVIRLKGTFQDITERKQLEQAVEKARADFLFAVSHELKTPLHVMGAIQEMIESLPEERQLAHFRDYSDFWRRNMMRLRFIIENLVDSQRPPGMGLKLEKQPANLLDLAREIARELEPVASARSVQFRFQAGLLPLVSMDSNAVRRLVENLLTNAIKFSHPGGQVEIRLRTEGEMACLDIADFGMGIDPQIKPFLFQPFYRSPEALKAGVQGTGLGLYVSKMIAEAHGGTIQLESEPGKGTTVTVQLPMEGEPGDPIQDLTPGS